MQREKHKLYEKSRKVDADDLLNMFLLKNIDAAKIVYLAQQLGMTLADFKGKLPDGPSASAGSYPAAASAAATAPTGAAEPAAQASSVTAGSALPPAKK